MNRLRPWTGRSDILFRMLRCTVTWGLLLAAAPLAAQVFTAAQAAEGRKLYAASCATCHGADGTGGAAPAMAGQNFTRRWNGRPVAELFNVMRTTMPPGNADSVKPPQQLLILTFLLQRNGYPPGTRALTLADAERKIALGFGRGGTDPLGTPKKDAPAFLAGKTDPSRPEAGPTQAELNAAAASKRDWLYHTQNYAGTRYSPLEQITAANARELRAVCAFQVGETANFQTGPLVHDGTMYLTGLHATIAIDAATCKPKWRHKWQPLAGEVWSRNRGVAIKDGRVVRGTDDGYLLALDAATGEMLWARKVADTTLGETFTMPAMIFEDLVLIGPAGSENGISGWVGAFRLSDGTPVWRFKTVPGAREGGNPSWGNPKNIVLGGGSVWTPLSLDPEKGELYAAVSNPAPDLPAHLRPGDNLYTNSMIALDVRTGALRWYRQMVPNDSHDWDLTQVSPLFKARVGGRELNLIATVGKDGYLRTVDRVTRELVNKTAVTTIENWDVPVTAAKPVHACPGVMGGVEWNGPAFSPRTNLLYTPAVDWCGTFKADDDFDRQAPGRFFGGSHKADAKAQGWLTAVDASTGEVKWKHLSPRPMVAAVTATAGDVVFAGELTGDFRAFDARTGAPLYQFQTGGPMGGGIVTYEVKGKQYVAAASGSPSAFWVDQNPGAPTVFVFALPQ